METLEYICTVGCIALMGADRIDLFGGHGFFKLSPFLFLASLVVLIRLLMLISHGRLRVPIVPSFRRQTHFLIVLALFLFVSFTSTIFGLNPQRGLVALCGLVLLAALGYCISVRMLADPAPAKLVVRSVTFALISYLAFCVGSAVAWSHGVFRLQEEAATSIESIFAPTSTLLWAPRMSGFCLDANRAGFILVMYLVLLDRFAAKTRYTRFLRFAIVFFIFLTLSRSAMLCWLAYYLFSGTPWKHLATLRTAFSIATIAIICLLVGIAYREKIAGLLELWQVSDMVSDRLSGAQGSSGGDHIQLIERGLQTWSSSTRTVLTGIGFAGAPRFLGDFFGDNKYGHFHCLYVTVLAELGLPAFLLFMVLLGYPIIGRRGASSCIAAIAIFNFPYQSNMEPIFWVLLALVWSFERKNKLRRHLA